MLGWTLQKWQETTEKRVLLFGMSGLGKTYLANMLRASGNWFHYCVDYRIGTRYMGEHIVDNVKAHAMRDPFLARLLRSDSIYIASNITFDNLSPLSTYLGQPGAADRGGLAFAEYQRRQMLHIDAEIAAMEDTEYFITRAQKLYGYQNFVTDTGGSFCEVVNPYDRDDPLLNKLAAQHLMIWIKGSEAHKDQLIARFEKAPKPMCYHPDFLAASWQDYLKQHNTTQDAVNPDEFARWAYSKALAHRQPRYSAIAQNFGLTLLADDVARIKTPQDLEALIVRTLQKTEQNPTS